MHPVPHHPGRTNAPSRIAVVIPARYESTRLPGKALLDIAGRPMIEHVYRRAAAVRGVDDVIVATDDERIAAVVRAFGGTARMTHAGHRSGTDRVAEVARELACDIVVNLQGDEPAVRPEMIEAVVDPLRAGDAVMSTLRKAIEDPREADSPHVVKVVVDRHGDALYFSRRAVPYQVRPKPGTTTGIGPYKHIGLYGYRRDFLLTFAALPPGPLEMAESLEQLRALEHGYRIRVVETTFDSIGVDTPEDLERARRHLSELPAGACL